MVCFAMIICETEEESAMVVRLFDRYQRAMLKQAYSILHDNYLAEDAVQEALLLVAKNLIHIDEKNCKKTFYYLITIVHNTSLVLLKGQKRQGALYLDEDDEPTIADERLDVERHFTDTESYELLLSQINLLKKEWKAPFILKYAYNLSSKEAALVLDISVANVDVRIHRAKKKLIEILQRGGMEHE